MAVGAIPTEKEDAVKASSNRTVLIARWRKNQEPSVDPPFRLVWGDGSPATIADFHAHVTDTYTIHCTPDGAEARMYPDICVDVRYDAAAGSWAVYGVPSHPISLDLADPAASDHQIEAHLSTLPTVYRARICRDTPVRS